jgi:hypothetical protein
MTRAVLGGSEGEIMARLGLAPNTWYMCGSFVIRAAGFLEYVCTRYIALDPTKKIGCAPQLVARQLPSDVLPQST